MSKVKDLADLIACSYEEAVSTAYWLGEDISQHAAENGFKVADVNDEDVISLVIAQLKISVAQYLEDARERETEDDATLMTPLMTKRLEAYKKVHFAKLDEIVALRSTMRRLKVSKDKELSDVDIHDAIVASYTNWVSKLIEYGERDYEASFHSSDLFGWVLSAMGLSDTENEGPESLSKNPTLKDENDDVFKYVYDKFENELSIKRLREAAANLARHPEVDVWEYAYDYVLPRLIGAVFYVDDAEDAAVDLRLKMEEAQSE